MLAWQIESVFAEFPTALIQLHAEKGVLAEDDMNPVKDFEQDWSTLLSLTPYLRGAWWMGLKICNLGLISLELLQHLPNKPFKNFKKIPF